MKIRFYSMSLILCVILGGCSGSDKKQNASQAEHMTLKLEKADSLLQSMNSIYEFKTIERTEDPKISTSEKVIKSDQQKIFMLSDMFVKIDDKSIVLMDNQKKEIDVFKLTKKIAKKSVFDKNTTLYWAKLKGTNKMGLSADIWFLYFSDSKNKDNSKLVNVNIKYKRQWTEIDWFLSKN